MGEILQQIQERLFQCPQEEGTLLRKWETVKVDCDQKQTPPNALCSKTGPIGKSEQGWADPEVMEKV